MYFKIKSLTAQDCIAMGQLIVAVLMLCSLWQTSRNLDYTKSQIEASKTPSLEVASLFDDQLHLLNSGGPELDRFQIAAHLAVYYQEKTEDITQIQLSTPLLTEPFVHQRLRSGEEFNIPFSKLTIPVGIQAELGEQEAFTVVFRYYRVADNRQFFKIVSFLRSEIRTASGKKSLYFPLFVSPGSGISGPNKPVFIKLRKGLRELCSQYLDLKMLEDAQ
jgi:hypothetical protein